MRRLAALACVAAALACTDPSDRRPGTWLSGEPASFPASWAFSDAHPEIQLEVATPWLIPHSVTIWCAVLGDRLYVAARDPASKRWPGLVARDPEVRLRVADRIYRARLEAVEDFEVVRQLRSAYAAKYGLDDPPPPGSPTVRYWQVEPRS